MTDADKIVRHLLETEDPPEYLETEKEVGPRLSATLDAEAKAHAARFKQTDNPGEEMSVSIGNRHYFRREGRWFQEIRKRNPDYWNGFNYALLYGNYSPFSGILVKTPRTLTQKNFARAVYQIVDNALGTHLPNSEKTGVDGMEEADFKRLANDPKWPCYVINIDGTWDKFRA